MLVTGIMTGTSVDAIDIATCDIESKGDRQAVSLRSFTSSPFSEDLHELILRCMAGRASIEELSDLPFALAHAFADTFAEHCATHRVKPELIAVHGQTL